MKNNASYLWVFLYNIRQRHVVPILGVLEDTVMNSFAEVNKLSPEKRINFLKNVYHLMSQSGSGLVSEQFTGR